MKRYSDSFSGTLKDIVTGDCNFFVKTCNTCRKKDDLESAWVIGWKKSSC